MNTIKKILSRHGYTIKDLKRCYKKGICNGMGAKGGIKWTTLLRALPYFQSKKEKKLLRDLDLVSDIHDIAYYKGGNFIDFIKANYILGKEVVELLYWTTTLKRIIIFILVFGGTTLFGWKYFNWTK